MDDDHRCADYAEPDGSGRLLCGLCGRAWRDGWTECAAQGCAAVPVVLDQPGRGGRPVCLDHAGALPVRPGVVI